LGVVTKKRSESPSALLVADSHADPVEHTAVLVDATSGPGEQVPAKLTPKSRAKAAPKRAMQAKGSAKSKRTPTSEATPVGKSSSDDDAEPTDGSDDGEVVDAPADVEVNAELVDTDADESEHDGEHDAAGDEYEEAPLSESSPQSIAKMDAMAVYLRQIQRHRLLTPEETRELAIRFRETEDPAAAAKLVTSNLRLVVKIAYEYRRAYKNIMDLVQEGNIGLMQAVKRYDPYRGVKLSSYGAWWIRAYILRFILNNWRLVKLGTTQAQRKLFFNLRKTRAELQARGIDPSDAEVAKRLNVSETEVSEMEVRLSSGEKSLDAPVGDSDGRSIARVDMLPSMALSPEALMADGELQAILKQKLDEFRVTIEGRTKDMAIFDLRLIADDPLTLQELGERFGISRERVRQLEQRLTSQLREHLKRELGDTAHAD
jgi:RNA polymerase sigma-32 factor